MTNAFRSIFTGLYDGRVLNHTDACSILLLEKFPNTFRRSERGCQYFDGSHETWKKDAHYVDFVMCQLEKAGVTDQDGEINKTVLHELIGESRIGWLFRNETERSQFMDEVKNISHLFTVTAKKHKTPGKFLRDHCSTLGSEEEDEHYLPLPLHGMEYCTQGSLPYPDCCKNGICGHFCTCNSWITRYY